MENQNINCVNYRTKKLFINKKYKNKILHDLYNKIPDNKIPSPETREKILNIQGGH